MTLNFLNKQHFEPSSNVLLVAIANTLPQDVLIKLLTDARNAVSSTGTVDFEQLDRLSTSNVYLDPSTHHISHLTLRLIAYSFIAAIKVSSHRASVCTLVANHRTPFIVSDLDQVFVSAGRVDIFHVE
jgi:hypothetical protein